MIPLRRVALLATLSLFIGNAMNAPVEAQSIGDAMVTYLKGQQNSRLGGGRSAHMATEALRVSGGEFYPADLGADFPANGDRVWGTLVTVMEFSGGVVSDSNPGNACLPGDVVQFGGSAIVGSTSYPATFTAVVQSVGGGRNRPTMIFQQNLGGVKSVQSAAINPLQLSQGWIRIYRPVDRIDTEGTWKFVVVNNASSSQTYTVMFGVTTVKTIAATAANTSGSYAVHKVTTDGTVPCVVTNDQTIYVETAKANEIYDLAPGQVDIRQLSQ